MKPITIEYQPSESSQVAAWGYDAASQTLGVKFRSGGEYHYLTVPQAVADAMGRAESLGKFVTAQLRGKFPYERQPDASGIVFGLPQKQEPKYTVSQHGRIVNRSTGKPIPDNEPVFILRAKDGNAARALQAYIDLCKNPDHRAVAKSRLLDFIEFATNNADLVREPDSSQQDLAGANVGRAPFTAAAQATEKQE